MPLWEWFYRYYFRVTTDGWHNFPDWGSVLVVGSHNGGTAAPDMHMLFYDWFRRFGTQRPAYGLTFRELFQSPRTARQAAKIGALPAEPGVAIAALQKGAAVLVYPGGVEDLFRPHSQRHQIKLAGRKGFIKLALREGVPIVPIVSTGAHDTLIVLTDCQEQVKQLKEWDLPWSEWAWNNVFPIYLGLPWGLALGPVPNLPLPIPIHTRVCAPVQFERYGRKAATDHRYVDACYEKVRSHMQSSLDELVIEQGRDHCFI